MHVHDVLIIGGGPAGLAAAARLCEHTPSATFTDDEHQRYHWIRKHGRKVNIKNYKTNQNSLPTPPSSPSSSDSGCSCTSSPPSPKRPLDMLVLDAEGPSWMSRWNRLFRTFGIVHLRSPMFFHVDPADRDALLGYAHETQREDELIALPGCAGREISKHRKKKKMNAKGRFMGHTPDVDERDRKDYYTPSTQLFAAHCREVVKRYGLAEDIMRHESVQDIAYDAFDDETNSKIFRVTTSQGTHHARIVILAVGPGNTPVLPPSITGLPPISDKHPGATHAMHITTFPPLYVQAKIAAGKSTSLVVVGGGLSSIQLADLALRRGVRKVYLLMRGPVKVKYFDIELDWVGKFRNFNQAAFWSADTDEERFDMYTSARNGGSITPRYRKILDKHVANGTISLHTYTQLESVTWDPECHVWRDITLNTSANLPQIDHIVFATGVQTNIHSIPFLNSMLKHHPIPSVGGLPCVNHDLMWNDDVPLFVAGRLAGLRLGPGAPNLVGARIGAERIAWNVGDVLAKVGRGWAGGDGGESEDGEAEEWLAYAGARGNRFHGLGGGVEA